MAEAANSTPAPDAERISLATDLEGWWTEITNIQVYGEDGESLYRVEALYRFALAASGLSTDEDRSAALWLIACDLWEKMVARPVRSTADALIKLRLVTEAFEEGQDIDSGSRRCLNDVANFLRASR